MDRFARIATEAIALSFLAILIGASGYQSTTPRSFVTIQATSASWNPATSCNAVPLTLEQFVGNVPNPTQTSPSQGADYSGGALLLEGATFAGTSISSSAWPYSKRSTSPPCGVTISNGTILPTLVEIHGVKVGPLSNDECGTVFSGVCDVSFNICDAVLSPICSSTFPFTMDQAHAEIDMYWTNGGIAPPTPTAGATIDVQGFAYWDDAHVSDAWHDFSGWEIHPVTAWRISANSSLQASFTLAPSAPNTNQSISFTASPIGGTSPYSYSWDFGDGTTSSIVNPTHSYNNAAIFSVILTITDSRGGTASSSRQITVNSAPPPPALTSSFSYLPSSPTTSIVVSFSSQASGGVSPYSFNWSFGDGATGAGSSALHSYIQAGSYTVTLSVTDSAKVGVTAYQSLNVAAGGPIPPIPLATSFTQNPGTLVTGTMATFTATATGGTGPYSYSWNFGDGGTTTGATAGHSYTKIGNYTLTLTTTDYSRNTVTESQGITVSSASTPPSQPPSPPPSNRPVSGGGCLICPSLPVSMISLLAIGFSLGGLLSVGIYLGRYRRENRQLTVLLRNKAMFSERTRHDARNRPRNILRILDD